MAEGKYISNINICVGIVALVALCIVCHYKCNTDANRLEKKDQVLSSYNAWLSFL